jgi:hypothetical protein
MLFTPLEVAALERCELRLSPFVPGTYDFSMISTGGTPVPLQPSKTVCVISQVSQWEEMRMKKALAILATIATVGATTVTAPAEARGIGPGLAFGLAAGALTAGAVAAGAYPYYYGPGYAYYDYGPTYYYGAGPYAYYGRPYYRHRYWRHYHYW